MTNIRYVCGQHQIKKCSVLTHPPWPLCMFFGISDCFHWKKLVDWKWKVEGVGSQGFSTFKDLTDLVPDKEFLIIP